MLSTDSAFNVFKIGNDGRGLADSFSRKGFSRGYREKVDVQNINKFISQYSLGYSY